MGLDFTEKINESGSKITKMEKMLGVGLKEPFNNTSSSSRRIMFYTHSQHAFPLMTGEKAVVETGYEIRYGDRSSSIIKADANYRVAAKVSKFSFAPNHHYFIILVDDKNKTIDMVERISYFWSTESYGYLNNNEYLDSLRVGDYVPQGTIVQKSLAFDTYNNRKDGVNLNVCYMSLDDNMEDSIILSEAAAAKMSGPLIKPVEIMINDNDIPVNIYGDDQVYKIIPDIGEDVKDSIIIALRKEKKEESLYNQAVDKLRTTFMSDDKRQAIGKVIDVDIMCNNPDILEGHYYGQLKLYYTELQRYSSEVIKAVMPFLSNGYKPTYELEKLYTTCEERCNNWKYLEKKPYSNILLRVTVLEEKKMEEGDKAANRYGGKGICSYIWPTEMMPRFKNARGEYEYVDLIFNSSTMYGRENVGQMFELELTHIGCAILDHIVKNQLGLDEAFALIHKYYEMRSPILAKEFYDMASHMSREELAFYIENVINDGAIHISLEPISESMTINDLEAMYDAFPFVKLNDVEIAMRGSNGQIRHIPSRVPILVGKQYIIRLKQYSEEKFSATSLSATNIKNENTKSRAKKDFKELYANTPIRFGSMETNNMCHIGPDAVITNMMIHSLSPQGRRLVQQMYTEDPFDINIRLDSDSRNRSAEIVNVYLKTIGRRMKFIKKYKKKRTPFTLSPFNFSQDPFRSPFEYVPEEYRSPEGLKELQKIRDKREKSNKKKNLHSPFVFDSRSRKKE